MEWTEITRGAESAPGRGRFAPSPTGSLHLGNLRTALLAWLFARSRGGGFLIRVEDLDGSRVRPGAVEEQLCDLRALGLDWDGEVLRQSRRLAIYSAALGRLSASGRLYSCYCTRAEIREASSAPHGPGHYPGTCRDLTSAQRAVRRAELAATGRSPALRVRAAGLRLSFTDRLLGEQPEHTLDDFVVRRNDGSVAYQLAVTVDDALQGIGEVVRGDDLLDSTPRQLLLARWLGLTPPAYTHVPLVLGADGQRLAKRHGAVTLTELRHRGYTPRAALGWMAHSLGLAEPAEEPEPATLLARFDPGGLPDFPTVWDPALWE